MGPTVTKPVQDPLAVLLPDNRLYIHIIGTMSQVIDPPAYCREWIATGMKCSSEYIYRNVIRNVRILLKAAENLMDLLQLNRRCFIRWLGNNAL